MSKKKHAVRDERVLEVGGKPVGMSFVVRYDDGPPDFGICDWLDCDERATNETLLGIQLCAKHFSDFYSDKPAQFKQHG